MKKALVFTLATIALALAVTGSTFGIQPTSALVTVEHGQDVSDAAHRANSGISDAAIGDPNVVPGLATAIGNIVKDVAIPPGGCSIDSNPATGC